MSSLAARRATIKDDTDELQKWKATTDGFLKALLKKKVTHEQQREEVSNLLKEMEAAVSSNPFFVEKFRLIRFMDEMNTYLFAKICGTIFGSAEDKAADEALSRRIEQIQWITPQHLDIPGSQINHELWDAAKAELKNVNSFVTPKEKLICILNCCKILIYLLQDSGTQASADDFLPHIIYVTIKTNLPHLHSNVKFICSYTDPEHTNDEAYCFFTHLQSAVAFIEMMDASCLTISIDEYNRFMGLPPTSTSELDKDLMAQKKTSKKALQLLGVSPSTTVVMKKFGIDAKTAYTMATSPPGSKPRANTESSSSESVNSPVGSPLPSLPESPRDVELPALLDQKASAPIAIEGTKGTKTKPNTYPLNDTKTHAVATSMTKSRSVSDVSGTWRQGMMIDKKSKLSRSLSASDPAFVSRFPFLDKKYEDLTMGDVPHLLAGYKELAALVISNDYSVPIKRQTLFSIKVRQKGETLFKLVPVTSMSLSSLQKAIRKRFKMSRETRVALIILLPDIIVERSEDLEYFTEDSQLEVEFENALKLSASKEQIADDQDETLPEVPLEGEEDNRE